MSCRAATKVDVSRIDFCRDYRSSPDGTYDLLGVFNTLTAPRLPLLFGYSVCVHFDMSVEDQRYRRLLSLRVVGASGGWAAKVDEWYLPREGSGRFPPHFRWVTRVQAEFTEAGYHNHTIVVDGEEIATSRLLVTRTRR
jgi:hypothetical protein